jgi:tetratricopeptide (TPR) repeat protein
MRSAGSSPITMSVLDSRTIVWALASRGRRGLTLAAVGLASTLLALEALRIASAATLAESDQPEALQAALTLDPSNAGVHHRLGLLRFYASAPGGPARGRQDLQRATELNPDEALFWLDLASACESSGDTACADHAVERALALSPMTPRISWAAANYYLRSNRQQKALPMFRRLLSLDASYAGPALQVCVRTLGDPSSVAEEVAEWNRNPNLEIAFVSFMTSQGDNDDAFAAWRHFASDSSAGASLPTPPVASYLNHLIDADRESEALAVWADLKRLGMVAAPRDEASEADPNAANLIFNGGFEESPLNWGFDWRQEPMPGTALSFPAAQAHTGLRCLQLEFTMPLNQEYEPAYQVVAVVPNQSYVLSAFVRSEDIGSDSGPRLRVVDPFCSSCTDLATDSAVTTTPWHPVQLSFSTSPQTHFVRISLWRPRSRSFPSEITGKFWLDDVSLVAAAPQGNRALREAAGTPAVRPAAWH